MNTSHATLNDWLDDLCVRFIVNLPMEELASVERICFQIEEAQWFYEDFVRPLNSALPSLNLKQFCMLIFQQCSLFAGWNEEVYVKAFSEFLTYKTRVPVRGAIMLNEAMDQCVLVKGWKKSANWSFPRGKINKGEADLACAIREVYEETGFDIQEAGLVPADESQVKSIEITMREQHMKLFVFHNVPMDTVFQPRTRKEISSIQWYRLADLPTLKKTSKQQNQDVQGEQLAYNANKFYMVAPFMSHLKKYIASVRKREAVRQQEGLQPAYFQDPSIGLPQQPAGDEAQHSNPLLGATLGASGNDMDRLLNQLRQSDQASRETNFPEAIPQPSSVPDTSSQLRSMLNVPSNQASIASASPNLLHLLQRPVEHRSPAADPVQQFIARSQSHSPLPPQQNVTATSWSQNQPQTQPSALQGSVPQTPLEQVFGQPQMPASPKHHHRPHQVSAGATTVTPPSFAYSPAQVRQDPERQAPPQPSATMAQPVQALWHTTTVPAQQPINRARSPAPFQQSGHPVFSNAPQSMASVPEPSRLPPPKLNPNSAKLLSLFKVNGPTPAAEMSGESSSTPELVAPQIATSSQSSFRPSSGPGIPIHSLLSSQGMTSPLPISTRHDLSIAPALASPTEIGPSSPAASRPRTAQQTALLDLFKAQPSRTSSGTGRASGTLSPALAPAPTHFLPHLPAELSNASSPAQTGFSGSDKRRSGSREALAPAKPQPGSKITIQKRPTGHTPLPSMSATVSGPLQVTEQDFQKPNVGNSITPGSVKILSRPATAGGPAQGHNLEASPKTSSPKPRRSPRRRPESKQAQASPKPFQPQILKRPAERSSENGNKELHISMPATSTPQILRREPELPSPMSRQTSQGTGFEPVSAIGPAPIDGFDRRSSQSSDQKATLLSLFTKPVTQQPVISPLSSMPRTRMGSLASNGSGEPGRATPQTSDKDKRFLLGFLNNMVNDSK